MSQSRKRQLFYEIGSISISGVEGFNPFFRRANVILRDNLYDLLYTRRGKTNVEATVLTAYSLQNCSFDATILAEFARLNLCPVVHLAYFFKLLEGQSQGEDGLLSTTGVNVVYIKGYGDKFYPVYAIRRPCFWVMDVYWEFLSWWRSGTRVFSCVPQ